MGKVRLEVVADIGAKRGQTFSGIVVEKDYEAIMKAVLNKMKTKRKDNMLLLIRDKYQGTQVLPPDRPLENRLRDGATIVLTTQRPRSTLPVVPRWPWPLLHAGTSNSELDQDPTGHSTDGEAAAGPASAPPPPPPQQTSGSAHTSAASSGTCRQEVAGGGGFELPVIEAPTTASHFPELVGDVRPLLRAAIAGEKSFLEKDHGDYLAFDYHTAAASTLQSLFPDPASVPKKGDARLQAQLRRECRGLLVCGKTGQVLARRFPKFFNVDEVEETSLSGLSDGGWAAPKVDGSLVSPMLLGGEVRWLGKGSIFPSLEAFVQEDKSGRLNDVARRLLERGETPIFEWCEEGPPVGVLTHAQRRLVLLAVRNNVSGSFWPPECLRTLGVDAVDWQRFESIDDLHKSARSRVGEEGLVAYWPERGLFVKIKSTWWLALAAAQKRGGGKAAVALASALESIPLSAAPSSLIWQATLSAEDDHMALVYGRLLSAEQGTLRKFAAAVEAGSKKLHDELRDWGDRAADATEVDLSNVKSGWPTSLLSAYVASGKDELLRLGELRRFLMKLAGSDEFPALEALLGCSWSPKSMFEQLPHLGIFETASQTLTHHVLNVYLPKKMEDYLGHAVDDSTTFCIERLYQPSEGKLKGLWEDFVKDGIIDLRVDLQPRGKVYDFHSGDSDFALLEVQFGPNDNCPRSTRAQEGDSKGAFAGVLIKTDMEIGYSDLKEAMAMSFRFHHIIKLDPSVAGGIYQIYMDLDGVLVDFDAGFKDKFGHTPDRKVAWQHIDATPGFFENLPWMPVAKRLWDHVVSLGLPTTVLTGIAEGALGLRCAEEKRSWVRRELGEEVKVITCMTRDKPQYSGPGRLLIDDRSQPDWEVTGGRQIRHTSVEESLSALVELNLGRSFQISKDKVLLLTSLHEDLAAAAAEAEALAFDVEWPPDRAGAPKSQAALLQLAFRPCPKWDAFVIDLLNWDEDLKDFIIDLMASEVPKYCFGPEDSERLGFPIESSKDLQPTASTSLAMAAREVGIVLQKSKALQACDWSQRPLRDEQVSYAATDAAILFELVREAPDVHSSSATRSQDVGRAATVEFSGIFLTPVSRQKLLRRVAPKYHEVLADHMTLDYKPPSVKGLSVGASVKLEVVGFGSDDKIQAVSVRTLEPNPREGHVTLSKRPDAEAAEAGGLQFSPLETPFLIDGVLGVSVLFGGVDRNSLPPTIQRKLQELSEGQPGESFKFEDLSEGQRYAVHLAADELGLEHRSEGKKGTSHRKLIVSKPKGKRGFSVQSQGPAAKSGPPVERVVVKAARKFAALFGDTPGLLLHGKMTPTGPEWTAGAAVPTELVAALGGGDGGHQPQPRPLVVILRGFPGSGKSTFSSILRKNGGLEVVSADDNLCFCENDLHRAHEECRRSFEAALANNRSVIVDNTNVRKSEYSFYRAKAETQGYAVVVVEFVCESTSDLDRLRSRSIHNVPGSAVGAMWARWEQDMSAIRILPFLPLSLMNWVRSENFIGRQPTTHLVMPRGPMFSVPSNAREEFHKIFAREWGNHPISEQASPTAFRLFFDIDGLCLERLLSALPALHDLLEGAVLAVTGTEDPPKPGYHVFVASKIVSSKEAKELTERWQEACPELVGVLDDQVYKAPQLRLLGSRKVTKEGLDLGRVHRFLGRYDGEWREDTNFDFSEVSILV